MRYYCEYWELLGSQLYSDLDRLQNCIVGVFQSLQVLFAMVLSTIPLVAVLVA